MLVSEPRLMMLTVREYMGPYIDLLRGLKVYDQAACNFCLQSIKSVEISGV